MNQINKLVGKRVCVISYPDYKETEIYIKLIDQLNKLDCSFIELDLSSFDESAKEYSDMDLDNNTNIISVGGDGTALKGMYLSYLFDSVLLPLGLGEIGYLVNSDKRRHQKLIKKLVENDIEDILSERTVLSCPTVDKNWPIFNEVAITKSGKNTLLEFNIEFNNDSIYVKSDGFIVSTSGGSTAYSYSAGGPVVDPSFDSMVLTPIAPFSKFPRSIVVPAGYPIRVKIGTPKYLMSEISPNYDIFFDGVLVNELISDTDDNTHPIFEFSQTSRKVRILGLDNRANISEFLSQILR